jgi:protoheme IX farnesyltransferase
LNSSIAKPFGSSQFISRIHRQLAIQCRSLTNSAPSTSASVSNAVPSKAVENGALDLHSLKSEKLPIGKRIAAYCELSKLKLSTFVVITAGAGFSVAPAQAYDMSTLQLFGCAMLGTLLCSGCANTINQIREVEFDALMKRTASRPLPSGLMTKSHAAAFAAVCGLSGTGLLYAFVNPLTAALGAANILLYAGPYTSMKRTTIWNTWIGAIVGAVPPVMGWTAVTGSIDAPSLLLAGILFSWQLPHFMSLAFVPSIQPILVTISYLFADTWRELITQMVATKCYHALTRVLRQTLLSVMHWPCRQCYSRCPLHFNLAQLNLVSRII